MTAAVGTDDSQSVLNFDALSHHDASGGGNIISAELGPHSAGNGISEGLPASSQNNICLVTTATRF